MLLGLAFSGGKDSLACWYLYREKNPIVFWVNTGKVYPETFEIINEVRADAKEFIEVKTDQQDYIDRNGIPSDIVPIDWTKFGMSMTGQKPVMVQSYIICCYENIAAPLNAAAKARGVTHLIRGQRNDESHKSTSVNGSVFDGIEFIQPIEDWTSENVIAFIKQSRGSIPDHYKIEHSSLDCYDCTAYLDHSQDRLAWTKERYPAFYAQYVAKMIALKTSLAPTMAAVERFNG